MSARIQSRSFPHGAGILLGLGLGGFFDGIVFHQLLQWHHMLSSWYPVTSVENLRLNTMWDGIFHAATYLLVLAGLFILWRSSHRQHLYWSSKLFFGTVLMGFGLFNCIEGIVDHHLLVVHRVNETVPESQRIYWDIGFLAWGLAMLVGGWLLWRQGKADMAAETGGSSARAG
jgi:uncharacterized membrane protein